MNEQPKQGVILPVRADAIRLIANQGGYSPKLLLEVLDSHEQIRRRHVDLIERTGPVDLLWNDPEHEPRRVAVAGEWPHLAELLHAMRKPT